jgi:glycosyltransferase involved in cell wall biosynthesis
MTHVLHIATWHPYVDGVAGLFILDQCAALQAAGVQVGLIFCRIEGLRGLTAARFSRGLPGFVELAEPVPTFGFKSWNFPGLRRALPSVYEGVLENRYKTYMRRHGRPDVLHAHVALEAGPGAAAIAHATGLDYVVTEHASEILVGELSPYKSQMARQVYEGAKHVIAVSAPLADRIRALAPKARISVIGNVVRDDVFLMRRARRAASDQILVVSISSLTSNKRLDHALRALDGLPEALRKRIDYRIVGDGAERRALELQARGTKVHTSFAGNLPHSEAMALLAKADLFLHPSAYETFGVVLAEAMALGIPIVATREGGHIVPPPAGTLVAADDIAAMTQAIETVLRSPSRQAISDEAVRFARRSFHESSIASAIAGTYQ